LKKKNIFLCSISNVISGTCREDCKFCTQSLKYKANIERYSKKDLNIILKEVEIAKNSGALGFCLVTAGKGLNSKTLDYMLEITEIIHKKFPNLNLIACNGTATTNQLKELKNAGISSYNHNLETSKEFYPQICSTHTWEERFETCENVKSVGLKLCSGGIFGLGETEKDRESFINSLIELNPDSVPINFYHHNRALPLQNHNLSIENGLNLIKKVSLAIGEDKILMVAGGRESLFKEEWIKIFNMGANAIVIGNYLTTKGNIIYQDIETLKENNYNVATKC
jgi:biotin synthase